MEDVAAYNADELEAMGINPNSAEAFTSTPTGTMASGVKGIGTTDDVLEAKKKRERMRVIGAPAAPSADDDFISLSETKKSYEYSGPHPESRLMREEDDLGEGDDDMAEYTGAKERIPLGKKAKKEEARRRREGMIEMIENAEDDDEESKEWELAQLRRNARPDEDREAAKAKAQKIYKPAPIPDPIPIPTLGPAVDKLAARLTALTVSHAEHTSALVKLDIAGIEAKETRMKEMIEEAEKKRAWFSDLRDWIETVAEFLDAKFPELEKLENEHGSFMTERYEMISRRRAEDDEDDAVLFLSLPLKVDEGEQVDDLGRVVPHLTVSGPDTPVRRARRSARATRHSSHVSNQEDGYSTDSSLPPSDQQDFELAIEKMKTKIGSLLEDVKAKEFKDPRLAVGKRFGEWREKHGDMYTNAWGGLGAVGAWEFWTRLEIVGWDPLEETRSLDTFNWYTGLYDYSRPKQDKNHDQMEDEDEEPELGPDGDLVSSMIATAVIPRLVALIKAGAFDPYSSKHVRRIVDLAEQVEMSVPRENDKYQTLVQAVTRAFTTAVNSTVELVEPGLKPSAPPPVFHPSGPPARKRFLVRRLKLLMNMVRWRKYSGELFGIGQAMEKLVSKVVLPIAEGGWDVGGEEVAKRVVQALPPEVIPVELSSRFA
ncbi:hypothetical protein FRC02_009336 [Tulasnella sp. 418]|nr:hypothetical protein FRC02_009336 [Tulasnella sp. 418]